MVDTNPLQARSAQPKQDSFPHLTGIVENFTTNLFLFTPSLLGNTKEFVALLVLNFTVTMGISTSTIETSLRLNVGRVTADKKGVVR